MSFSIVFALVDSANFRFPFLELTVYLACFLFLWSLIFYNKVSSLIAGITGIAAFVGSLSYIILNGLSSKVVYSIYSIFYWLSEYVLNGGTLIHGYVMTLTLLLCFAVSLIVFILTFKKFSFPAILAFGALIFVSQWILGYFTSYISFYIFLFTISIYYFRHIYNRKISSMPGDYTGKGEFTFYVIPLCLIILATALLIPYSKGPIEWKWLDKKINSAYNYFYVQTSYFQNAYFNIASSGFGRSGKLGGKVRLDKTPVLTVYSNRQLYLKGAAYDTYNGSLWYNSDRSRVVCALGDNELYRDTKETLLGISLLSNNRLPKEKIFSKDKIEITYKNIKTKSIFYPVKSESINIFTKDNSKKQIDSNDILSSESSLGKGYSYKVDNYNIYYGSKEFQSLIRRSRKGLLKDYYESIKKTFDLNPGIKASGITIFMSDGDNITTISSKDITRFMESADKIYDKYLRLPVTLPDRVKKLAADVTSGFRYDYDKVKAIEQYLSSSFPYTLDVAQVPGGRDFVDYFLFDQKKGYCTYYATAMTVMVRSIGLPARYVEGYILPSKPSEGSKYLVTNENAHAWVEVYFEGFGWVPFEPTSAFRAAFYETTQSLPILSGEFSQNPDYLKYLEMLQGYNKRGFKIDDDFIPVVETPKEKYLFYKITSGIAAVLLLVFLTLMAFNYPKSRLALLRIQKSDPRHCILLMTSLYLKILSSQGYGIKPGETPSEYTSRIDKEFLYETSPVRDYNDPRFGNLKPKITKSSGFTEVMDVFSIAKYSAEDISDDAKITVLEYYDTLIEKTLFNIGKLRYFINRYILGMY